MNTKLRLLTLQTRSTGAGTLPDDGLYFLLVLVVDVLAVLWPEEDSRVGEGRVLEARPEPNRFTS